MILVAEGEAATMRVGVAAGSKSDSLITARLKSALLGDPDTFVVSVATKDGVVTLGGILHSQAVVDRVKALAKVVEGIQRVEATGLTVAART